MTNRWQCSLATRSLFAQTFSNSESGPFSLPTAAGCSKLAVGADVAWTKTNGPASACLSAHFLTHNPRRKVELHMLSGIFAIVVVSFLGVGQPASTQPPVAWWEVLRYHLPSSKPAKHSANRANPLDRAKRHEKNSCKAKCRKEQAEF